MKCKVVKAGPCRKELNITAEAAEVMPEYNKILDEITVMVRLPGFRKGKAPRAIVETKFRKEIEGEIKDKLLSKLYHEAIKQENIVPVAIVDVKDVTFDRTKGLACSILLDVAPEFKVPRYKGIKVKIQKVEIKDADVDENLERLRSSTARYEDVSGRAVKKGDLVTVDFVAESQGKALAEVVKEAAVVSKANGFSVMAGEQGLIPGMAEALPGMEAGTEKKITVKFPEGFRIKELIGKEALYTITARTIREKITPPLDEAFCKKFEVANETELRVKIRTELQKAAEASEKERQKGEILKQLVEKADLELPQSVVEEEKSLAVREMVRRSAMGGATKEQIESQKDGILDAAAKTSAERIKNSYVLARIASEEKIEATPEEVEARVNDMAARYGVEIEKIKAELQKNGRMESIASDIRAEKTLEFLHSNAKLTEKEGWFS
jgi:trigger factor